MTMKLLKSTISAALIAAGALGAGHATAQDGDIPAYLLANLSVEDMETYMNDYASPFVPLLLEAGGEVLVVAPEVDALEGEYSANLTVVIRFPSMEAAKDFYESDAYQALRPARLATTDSAASTLVLAPEFVFPSSN